jgi:hypothetical protein
MRSRNESMSELQAHLAESRSMLANLSAEVSRLPAERRIALGALGCFLGEAESVLARVEERAVELRGSKGTGQRESAPRLEGAVEKLDRALSDACEELRKLQWGQVWS